MVGDIFSIIADGARVEASFPLGQVVTGWRESKTTGEIICEDVIVRQFPRADNGISAGADPELNTTNTENDSEMKN